MGLTKMRCLFCCLGLLALGRAGFGQGEVRRFEMSSKATGATYAVEVVLPAGALSGGAKYPALFCTDWFILGDYLKALPKLMNMGRLTEPFILVGIAGPATMDAWATARTRDFTPARPADEYSRKNTYPPALEQAGGARKFAAFLRDELVPRVQADFPVDPARRGFLGYSLGALLGVYLLMNDPALFDTWLLGSPSLWFNGFELVTAFHDAPAKGLEPVRWIYLSVGEEESWEMLRGFGALRDALREKGFEGPRMKAEIIREAGHVGAMPIALYNGIRFLLRGR
ncbi:MAG: alpha/beta hydrolase [Acidobacteria bacterium]|nr:alpha/beta hydrolase [Acidobacteriota bacterium]